MKSTKDTHSDHESYKKPVIIGVISGVIILVLHFSGKAMNHPSGPYEPYKPGEHPGMNVLSDAETKSIRRILAGRGHVCPPPAYAVHNLRTDQYEVFCHSSDSYNLMKLTDGRFVVVNQ